MIVVKISTEKRKKNNKIAQKSQKSSLLLDFIFNNIYSTVNKYRYENKKGRSFW